MDNPHLQNAHLLVYNSAALPANSPIAPDRHVSLFKSDISTDLVFGYLLSTVHAQHDKTPRH